MFENVQNVTQTLHETMDFTPRLLFILSCVICISFYFIHKDIPSKMGRKTSSVGHPTRIAQAEGSFPQTFYSQKHFVKCGPN